MKKSNSKKKENVQNEHSSKEHNHKERNHNIKKSLYVLGVLLLFVFLLSFALLKDDVKKPDNLSKIFTEDNQKIDEAEFARLTGLSCDELRKIVGTEKKTCIYFKDKDERLIMLDNGKYGVGCNGLTIEGNKIC